MCRKNSTTSCVAPAFVRVGFSIGLFFIAIFSNLPSILAQIHVPFDGAETTWNLTDADCVLPKSKWIQQRKKEPGTQNSVEQIYFQAGPGTKIMVAHPITPTFVIPELSTSVRVKASRKGIRLLVRVVLPHSQQLDSTRPITTFLLGPENKTVDNWETLEFKKSEISELLRKKLWVLRRQYGSHVSVQNAYVDQVVLNVYTAQGLTDLLIDDLRGRSIVPAEKLANRLAISGALNSKHSLLHDDIIRDPLVQQASRDEPDQKHPSLVLRDGTVILAKKKPFFARIIQHNGESFEFLKSAGFNTVQLRNTATVDQLRRAEKLNLWIVCPPPASIGAKSIPFSFDRVLAWSVGENRTARDLSHIQTTVREIRESDLRTDRPIVCNVAANWATLGREVDILSLGLRPIGTSFIASQYSQWIRERTQSTGINNTAWVDIQTEYSENMSRQARSIVSTMPPTPIEPQQIQFLMYEAIAGGARGLRFLSKTRLDGSDPASQLRLATLQYSLAEVSQIEPWAAGGAVRGELELSDPRLEVTALDTNRARLLLIQRPTHREQYWAGDSPLATISFRDKSASFTDRAYQITPAGLNPLSQKRDPSGIQITLENCPFSTAVVMTQDPLVISRLNSLYDYRPGDTTQMQSYSNLTRQWVAIMKLVESQMNRIGRSTPAASGALNEAVNSMRQADRLQLDSSDLVGLRFINRTNERLAFVRRELMAEPLGNFSSKTSTPLLTHFSLVPLHWQLAQRMQNSTWNPNSLAGGDFENLNHMTQSGWNNRRIEYEGFTTQVELSKDAATAGTYGLKMSVNALSSASGIMPSPPLWISSAPVSVKSGQIIRIHGWVNVPETISHSHDGLMITDNLGGPALAERIPLTNGWQEFTMYRGVPENGSVSITLSMTGVGVAKIDELTIRAIELPPRNVRRPNDNNQR